MLSVSNEDVIWKWLDGCRAANRALRTDGKWLHCHRMLIAETRSQWKTVAIRTDCGKPEVQRVIERIKALCHTIGYSDVGNLECGELERTSVCQDL